jgi:glycosyltransferase involved in cell wall biosynthesis
VTQIKPFTQSQIKTALIYDRVNTRYGGAEQVILALHQLFPDAPLYTSVYNPKQAMWAQDLTVKTSFLQKLPGAKQNHRVFAPLMPLAFEQLDLSDFELIISVTSAEAKGVITKPEQTHLCYLLSPPRYLYSHQQEYLQSRPFLNWFGLNLLTKQLLNYLEWWDQAAIHRPDYIIPLSKVIQQRVKTYYDLETLDPIYPPVDVPNTQQTASLAKLKLPKNFNLVVSRLVPYKKIDLAIRACQNLQQPLVIVGAGPQLRRLTQLVYPHKSPVIFLGPQPQAVVNSLLAQAKLLLSPGQDDFGLVALQANLQGTPAVINAESGVSEILIEEVGGVKLHSLSIEAIERAMQRADHLDFKSDIMKQIAQKHSMREFLLNFKNVVQTILDLKNTN